MIFEAMATMHHAPSAQVQNAGIFRTYAFHVPRANYVCIRNSPNINISKLFLFAHVYLVINARLFSGSGKHVIISAEIFSLANTSLRSVPITVGYASTYS